MSLSPSFPPPPRINACAASPSGHVSTTNVASTPPPTAVMLGYVSWVQDCRNENMDQQDDLMHEACRGAFGPSATAASEKWWFEHGKDKELGGISSHPPNYLIFTQPLVCSNYEAYSPCIGGYGRNCHSQSMDTLDTCTDYNGHDCGSSTRAALCVQVASPSSPSPPTGVYVCVTLVFTHVFLSLNHK